MRSLFTHWEWWVLSWCHLGEGLAGIVSLGRWHPLLEMRARRRIFKRYAERLDARKVDGLWAPGSEAGVCELDGPDQRMG